MAEHYHTNPIERFRSNDEAYIALFYKENLPVLRTYVLQNSGREDDAKDIFQEAVLAMWLNIKEGKLDANASNNLGAYVFRIAKNKWLDRLRSASFRKNRSMDEHVLNTPVEAPDDGTQERLAMLEKMYEGLDGKCRKVLDLFYYKKMSLEEIAAELEYDLGSIRTIKYRCMMKLREARLDL
jgi:RNA polymerase sigma factor (sigma-70 family)